MKAQQKRSLPTTALLEMPPFTPQHSEINHRSQVLQKVVSKLSHPGRHPLPLAQLRHPSVPQPRGSDPPGLTGEEQGGVSNQHHGEVPVSPGPGTRPGRDYEDGSCWSWTSAGHGKELGAITGYFSLSGWRLAAQGTAGRGGQNKPLTPPSVPLDFPCAGEAEGLQKATAAQG